jgi:DNA-binding MarR family transcriptional regulator
MIQPMSDAKTSEISQLETELAVLARTLEGMSRRSEIHRDLDRASYLIARTLDAEGPMSVSALADRLGVDATTITRQVARMEAGGLVARRTDDLDRRVRVADLTGRGRRKMADVRGRRESRIRSLVNAWPAADRRQFARLLGEFNEALRQPHEDGLLQRD